MTRCHLLLLAWSCAILSFFLGSPPKLAAGSVYSLVDLGALGTGAAMPAGINNSGTAVGFVTDPYNHQIPVTFNGQANSLGGYGQANAINAAGVVVGTGLANGNPNLMEWSNGQSKSLAIPGYGTAINNSGEIAGGYITSAGQLHAFTWSNGSMVDLGTLPGGTWSSAYGVNSSGQIAGTSSTADGIFRAFFSNGSGLSSIGTFAGANGSSYAMAINDVGEVVGNAQTAQLFSHAFVWTGGSLLDIGTLGGMQSYAYSVNDSGTVVGYSLLSDNSSHAFVYSNGVMLDLNDLLPIGSAWTIEAAYGVNASGDILGTAALGGQFHAVELLPSSGNANQTLETPSSYDVLATPEPGSFILGASGLIFVLLAGRFRKTSRLV